MATALTSIENDFKLEHSQSANMFKNIRQRKMIKIQRCYDCISLVVNQLHSKFEWIILSQVTNEFIFTMYFTSTIFLKLNFQSSVRENGFLLFTIWTIELFMRLGLITYTVDRIKTKVKLET